MLVGVFEALHLLRQGGDYINTNTTYMFIEDCDDIKETVGPNFTLFNHCYGILSHLPPGFSFTQTTLYTTVCICFGILVTRKLGFTH